MLWQWRTMQNFKTNWLVQNWHKEFNKFWPEHSKNSKMCPLLSWFWLKYIILQLRKLRGVMFDGSEYWFKIWRKTDFCFQKWHGEFRKFSPEHLKVSKLGLWWDSFVQSRTFMSLKLTGEFCLNDNEEWCKTWKGIELSVQNWNEDFDEFWPEPSKI